MAASQNLLAKTVKSGALSWVPCHKHQAGYNTQQILYVPVSALMMTSITCFPSIYLLSYLSSNLTTWWNCSLSFCTASLFLYMRAQGPSGLQTQQILYVPVTALMMPSITSFPRTYFFTKVVIFSHFCASI